MSIVDRADVPILPFSPRPLINLLFGIVAGFLAGLVGAAMSGGLGIGQAGAQALMPMATNYRSVDADDGAPIRTQRTDVVQLSLIKA